MRSVTNWLVPIGLTAFFQFIYVQKGIDGVVITGFVFIITLLILGYGDGDATTDERNTDVTTKDKSNEN